MAIGIYKPSQGYWVRVLTASMLGILTLATAAWVWGQAQIAVEKLPRSVWTVPLIGVQGTPPAPGDRVTLQGHVSTEGGTQGTEQSIATATVSDYDASNQTMRLRGVDATKPGADPSQAVRVELPGTPGGEPAFSGTVSSLPTAASAVEPLYVQGGAAALVILLGSILTYWFVALKPRTVEFLIATDTEMKKVNWSNWPDIRASTIVVIGACLLLALSLFVFDFVFQFVFRQIGIIAT